MCLRRSRPSSLGLTAPAATTVVGSFWDGLGALPRRARFVRFWNQQRWQQLGGVPANGRWPVQNVAVQVVLLRWHDRPLMRPAAGAAFAGALLSIRMRVGRGEPLSEALQAGCWVGATPPQLVLLLACRYMRLPRCTTSRALRRDRVRLFTRSWNHGTAC